MILVCHQMMRIRKGLMKKRDRGAFTLVELLVVNRHHRAVDQHSSPRPFQKPAKPPIQSNCSANLHQIVNAAILACRRSQGTFPNLRENLAGPRFSLWNRDTPGTERSIPGELRLLQTLAQPASPLDPNPEHPTTRCRCLVHWRDTSGQGFDSDTAANYTADIFAGRLP